MDGNKYIEKCLSLLFTGEFSSSEDGRARTIKSRAQRTFRRRKQK